MIGCKERGAGLYRASNEFFLHGVHIGGYRDVGAELQNGSTLFGNGAGGKRCQKGCLQLQFGKDASSCISRRVFGW